MYIGLKFQSFFDMKPMRLLFILSVLLAFSCTKNPQKPSFSALTIEPIIEDSLLNVRALELNGGHVVAVSSVGDVYRYDLKSEKLSKSRFSSNTLNVRSIALVNDSVFTLSIGSPAFLHKNTKLVYSETHPDVFYNSMDFWNDKEGIAMGDPTEGCLSILITRDGGQNWLKTPCDELPKAIQGEAAFAASDTNISLVGDKVWIASGGIASRVLFSADKGRSWEIFYTPIVQGTPTTGIYSIDFYDEHNGYAIGGDYTQPKLNMKTKIKTTDGGRSWIVVEQVDGPGYRSCVQYVSGSQAKALVAVGFEGIDYSSDGGLHWRHLSDEGFYTLRFLNDHIAIAAGKGRIAKLIFE